MRALPSALDRLRLNWLYITGEPIKRPTWPGDFGFVMSMTVTCMRAFLSMNACILLLTERMNACIRMDMDQMSQIRLLKRAMKAANIPDAVALAKSAGVDVTMVRKYLDEDPAKWVEIGKRNAPAIAKALNLPVAEVLYGNKAA